MPGFVRTARFWLGVLLWVGGTLAGSFGTLAFLGELAARGAAGNLGWAALGILFMQPPSTLAVLAGTALLWSAGSARAPATSVAAVEEASPVAVTSVAAVEEAGPVAATSVAAGGRGGAWLRAGLVAGIVWSCLAYGGLLFHNSGC